MNVAASGAIGFVGLGAMGAPMVRRLLACGHAVVVFDIDEKARSAAIGAGAHMAASPRQVADEAAVVCTCLPSLKALTAVLLGDDGVRCGERVQVVVDFSTTGADFARDLAAQLSLRGIALLDAPITGSVTTAGNGGLGIMCSGPAAAFARVEPLLRDLAREVVLYLGERSGRAQTLKLLNNLLSATGMATTCEAVLVGFKAGLDPWRMLEVINAGDASSSASRNKFPKSVLPRRFDYGARMAITAKDTSLTVGECEALGVPMWVGQAVRQVWNVAASQGGAERDGSSLITFLEPWAGVELPASDAARPLADAAPSGAVPEVAIVCDARLQRDVVRAAGPAASVHVVGATAGAAAMRAALPARAGRRLVVNLCPMASTPARAWAQAVADEGDGYVEAMPVCLPRDIGTARALYVVAGAAQDRADAAALLALLGGRALAVSERAGDAALLRDLHEALFATLLAATAEAFAAGAKAGLAPEAMTRIMGVETGRNAASARILPEEVATRRFDHGRSIGDLFAALERLSAAARELGVTPWILDRTKLLYGLAARLGSPDDDASRLVTHYERWAGAEVRPPAADGPLRA
jgi:3-hydroxyisobutyrate dehydrogenase-like beta-hydroxyacid dehydrogenase